MYKQIFKNTEIQHVEWVKNSSSGNPQYRITFNSYSGATNELVRHSWSMLTAANAGWAYGIIESRYNNGTPKLVTLEVSLTQLRERITNFTELRDE